MHVHVLCTHTENLHKASTCKSHHFKTTPLTTPLTSWYLHGMCNIIDLLHQFIVLQRRHVGTEKGRIAEPHIENPSYFRSNLVSILELLHYPIPIRLQLIICTATLSSSEGVKMSTNH